MQVFEIAHLTKTPVDYLSYFTPYFSFSGHDNTIIFGLFEGQQEESGTIFIRFVKNETSDIPVMMVTSNTHLETREKAMRLGAVDFISKPVKTEELIPRMRKYIM